MNNTDINLNRGNNEVNFINVNNAKIKNYNMINDNSLYIKANDNDKTTDIVNYKNDIYKRVYCKNIKGRNSKTYSIMTY